MIIKFYNFSIGYALKPNAQEKKFIIHTEFFAVKPPINIFVRIK